MILNKAIFICLANMLFFSIKLNALSKKSITAQDPQAKSIIATYELSPFHLMSTTSSLGALLLLSEYSTTNERSPDFNREKVKKTKATAADVLIYGGIVNQLFYLALMKPLINETEREKIGEVTTSDINPQRLDSVRDVFLFFHGLNFLTISAVASQSLRTDRWNIVAIQAVLPFVVDLSARYIFRSQTASPWTLAIVPKFENQIPTPELMISYSW